MARKALVGPRPRTDQQQAGDKAEDAAADAYVEAGCVVVARNVVIANAELDLVVKDGDVVVFVEVRQRRSQREARESVTPSKQKKLIRGAQAWLDRFAPDARARFDVVAVYEGRVVVVEDAFSA